MKPKRKWLVALLLMIGAFSSIGTMTVNAEKYTGNAIWPSEHIPNIYIKKERGDGYIKYQQAQFIRRSEDNKFVYCVQPYVDIDNNYIYDVYKSDYASVLNMTKEQWDRISLLAHYGYGYSDSTHNHDAQKWYAITQVMIWRTAVPSSTIYFTNTLNGTRNDNLFKSEIAEMEDLLANHYKKPSFTIDSKTITLGSTVTYTDTNNVLKDYVVESVKNVTAKINGNTLTVTGTSIGDASITLVKKSSTYNMPPVAYVNPYSQNVFRVGAYDPVYSSLDLKVIGGKVTVHKLDRDTGNPIPLGDATLGGAVYGIYYADTNELVTTITTSTDGTVTSAVLPKLTKYYLQEISSSTGYLIDKEKHYFSITEDDLYPEVDVYEQVIRRRVEIAKFYSQEETGILTPEVNIEFGIFDKNNKMVAKIVTDKNGWGEATLPYAEKYTVRQLNSSPNTEKVKDFTFSVLTQESESLKYTIVNKEISSKIRIVKIDSETKKTIPLAGIKFKILDSNNKEVCQTITYPTTQKVCEYETTKDGVLTTPYPLKSGNYKILEIDRNIPKGYLWNKTPLEFTIDENADFEYDDEYGAILEVKFSNKRVKGKITINKFGEELVIEDDSFTYERIPLSDVTFDIIANEDIIIGGNKFYSKGDLVTTITTKDGIANATLELGNYCAIEKNSNNDNMLDSTPKCFTLSYQDQYTELVYESMDIDNYLAKGKLEFTKTDLVTGEPIPNTLIEIFTEDGRKVFEGYTDENGKIVIDNLFTGKFYIIEKEANSLYQITDEIIYFEILENGEIVKASMTNQKIVEEVPNTGINGIDISYILGAIAVVGGLGVIVYGKKKKQK